MTIDSHHPNLDMLGKPGKTHAFVQARMGSTRLPKKMVAPIGDHPLLEWVLRRLKRSQSLQGVYLLTSSLPENRELITIAERCEVDVLMGQELNVTSRFVEAAERWPADHYIRVCADNPFICPQEIDRLVPFHKAGAFDYSFNHIPALGNLYVDGFGAEIFTAKLMARLNAETLSTGESEHVTKFFWNRREQFNFGILAAPREVQYPDYVFDIDTAQDLSKFQSIAAHVTLEMTGAAIITKLIEDGRFNLFLKSH